MKRGKNVKRKTARHKMSVQLTVKSSLYNSGKVTKVLKCTNTSTTVSKYPALSKLEILNHITIKIQNLVFYFTNNIFRTFNTKYYE